MEKQDLYSFDDTNINFNTSELDDIISSDDILKNFKDEAGSKLTFDESEVTLVKEEPLVDSFEKEMELGKEKPVTEKTPDQEETVLFSDETGEEIFKADDGIIVEDKETEQFVQQEINKTARQYSKGKEESESAIEGMQRESFFEEDGDETISLSSDELSNILEDTEEHETTAVPTVDSVLEGKEQELPLDEQLEEIPSIDYKQEPELSEEIPLSELSEEELEVSELPMEEIEEPSVMQEESSSSLEESEIGKEVSSFFEEDEDETIGLTGNELDNILKSTEIVEEAKGEEFAPEAMPSMTAEQKEEEVFESLPSEIIEEPLEEMAMPKEDKGFEEMGMNAQEQMRDIMAEIPVATKPEIHTSEDKQRLKMILKYLDSLLDYLPEGKIKEFAESEYYDLYHSLFQELGI